MSFKIEEKIFISRMTFFMFLVVFFIKLMHLYQLFKYKQQKILKVNMH